MGAILYYYPHTLPQQSSSYFPFLNFTFSLQAHVYLSYFRQHW